MLCVSPTQSLHSWALQRDLQTDPDTRPLTGVLTTTEQSLVQVALFIVSFFVLFEQCKPGGHKTSLYLHTMEPTGKGEGERRDPLSGWQGLEYKVLFAMQKLSHLKMKETHWLFEGIREKKSHFLKPISLTEIPYPELHLSPQEPCFRVCPHAVHALCMRMPGALKAPTINSRA